MTKKRIKTVLTAGLTVFFSAQLMALGGGTTNADFMKIGVGARPSAMSGAYTAVADDADACFWNPAGISSISTWEITAMHLIWYANTNYDYLSLVMPVDSHTNFGLSVNFLWIPEFNSTESYFGSFIDDDAPMSYDLAVTLSGAKNFGNFYTSDFTIGNVSAGINLTYISRSLIGTSLPSSFAVDIGGLANITESVKLGLALSDIGTSTGEDPSPFTIRGGLSYDHVIDKNSGVLAAVDVAKPVDLSNPDFVKWMFNLGTEIRIHYFKIRGGYRFGEQDISFSAGGGLSMPGLGSVDYAFVPHSELGSSHRISLSLKFGNPVPRPVIGAPRPPRRVTAISGDKIVSIGWDPNPEANIIGYNIYYKPSSSDKFELLNAKPIMEESKFKAQLKNNVKYDFAVTAINNRNLESVYSDVISAMPEKYVPKKPKRIEGVFTKTEGKSITVAWEESSSSQVVGYNLYYKKDGSAKYKRLNRKVLKESKATLAGLKPNIKYHFMITAVTKDGLESDFSDVASARLEEEEYY